MYQVFICGHYGEHKKFFDGQTIKTKMLTEELKRQLTPENIVQLDTNKWKNQPLRFLLSFIKKVKCSDNSIILPAQNGLKIFIPLLAILNLFFKKKIHYVVIGGWLPQVLNSKKYYLIWLNRFDNIFVETVTMQRRLSEKGLKNVSVMPNFKKLEVLSKEQIAMPSNTPFQLCTFSRVLKEKGIENAIEAVIQINSSSNDTLYTLDIYGQIDTRYEDEFNKLLETTPDYINYKGIIPYDEVVTTLKNYYLMLFPTYYIGEGFAGTIIDAFASALPVLATDWRYNKELIQDNTTGKIFPVNDTQKLVELLLYYKDNPDEVYYMKKESLKESYKYTPEEATREMIKSLK